MLNIFIFLIISLIYNWYIISKYGIPVSLSETSYLLKEKRYGFTLYCIVSSFLVIPSLLAIVPDSLTFLPFLMCVGLLFSGASPLFKKGLDRSIHYISSIISFISFIIFTILVMGGGMLLLFLILLIALVIGNKRCYVYFAETLAFLFISVFILI